MAIDFTPLEDDEEENISPPSRTRKAGRFLKESARTVGRTGKAIVSPVVGLPGDVLALLRFLGESGVEKVTGKKVDPNHPIYRQIRRATELPTSQDVRHGIERATGGFLAPETPHEREAEEAVELLTSLFLPGPKGAGGLAKAAVGTGLGIGTQKALEATGVGEGGQQLGKGVASLLPFVLQGRLSPSQLATYARRAGFTEKELTPLLQGEKKTKFLAPLAKRTGGIEKRLTEVDKRFGDVFHDITERASELPPLSPERSQKAIEGFVTVLDDLKASKLPPAPKRHAIETLQEALQGIHSGGVTGPELISTYRDINDLLRNTKVGRSALGKAKQGIQGALRDLDPALAQDFALSNELYARFKNFEKTLSPSQSRRIAEGILSGGEALGVLGSLAMGNLGQASALLGGAAATAAGRRVLSQLLINPNFQNFHKNIFRALKSNNPKVAAQLVQRLRDQLEKGVEAQAPEIDFQPIEEET